MVKYVNKVIKNTIQFFVLSCFCFLFCFVLLLFVVVVVVLFFFWGGGDFSGYQKYTQSKLKVEILGCKEKI